LTISGNEVTFFLHTEGKFTLGSIKEVVFTVIRQGVMGCDVKVFG